MGGVLAGLLLAVLAVLAVVALAEGEAEGEGGGAAPNQLAPISRSVESATASGTGTGVATMMDVVDVVEVEMVGVVEVVGADVAIGEREREGHGGEAVRRNARKVRAGGDARGAEVDGDGGGEGEGQAVLLRDGEFLFVQVVAPTLLRFDLRVLHGPNVNVFLLSEANFQAFVRNSWSADSWAFIDEGSKQDTRRAVMEVELVKNDTYYLVVEANSPASDYWSTLGGRLRNGQGSVTLILAVHSMSLSSPPVMHTAFAVHVLLLLFFALLPGWPLLRHYHTLLRFSSHPTHPPLPLHHYALPFLLAAAAASLLPLTSVEKGLQTLIGASANFSTFFHLPMMAAEVLISEELVKWVMLFSLVPLLSATPLPAVQRKGAYLILGATVAVAFALVENVLYGLERNLSSAVFDTLFVRALTSFPSHVVVGIIMGGLFCDAANWYGSILSLAIPVGLHLLYDLPILLAERGIFNYNVLLVYLLLLFYLEDGLAQQAFLDYRFETLPSG